MDTNVSWGSGRAKANTAPRKIQIVGPHMIWTDWLPFPDPRAKGLLTAPFGPGCYELRLRGSKELLLFGSSGKVAYRMMSLLPPPLGEGRRNNAGKRAYCLAHIADLEYRTCACLTKAEAVIEERRMKADAARYLFPT